MGGGCCAIEEMASAKEVNKAIFLPSCYTFFNKIPNGYILDGGVRSTPPITKLKAVAGREGRGLSSHRTYSFIDVGLIRRKNSSIYNHFFKDILLIKSIVIILEAIYEPSFNSLPSRPKKKSFFWSSYMVWISLPIIKP